MPSILEGVEELGAGGGGGGSASNPTIVQTTQQMVIAEINQTLSTKTIGAFTDTPSQDITKLFDKDTTTGYTTNGVPYIGPWNIHIAFQFPILIARVAISMTGPGPLIDVTDVDGTVTPVIENENFSPLMAISIDITLLDPSVINEVVILKSIEVKATVSVGNVVVDDTPNEPLFVQEQGVVVNEECTISASGMGATSPTVIMDHNPATKIGPAVPAGGNVNIVFKSPLLISRIGIVGLLGNMNLQIQKIDGTWKDIILNYTSTSGFDSKNLFTMSDTFNDGPILAKAVGITVVQTSTIFEVSIFKTKEVKLANQSAAYPLQVEAEQQVVIDEIDFGNSNATEPANLSSLDWRLLFKKFVLDLEPTHVITQTIPSQGVPSVIHIAFKELKLISRIALGLFFSSTPSLPLKIDINKIDDNTPVTVFNTILPENAPGVDTGNFAPVPVWSIDIYLPDATTTLQELAIYKTIEVKVANFSGPAGPVNVQALQQVVIDEIDVSATGSEIVNVVSGTIADLFDKNIATEVIIEGNASSRAVIVLKFPILISRVSYVAGPTLRTRTDVEIHVMDIEGNDHVVYDGSQLPVTYGDGVDSGNFKEQPSTIIAEGRTSPIMATSITIIATGEDYPIQWSIGEIVILKTIETKAYVYNEPSFPVFTQDEGVITYDEIWWPNATETNVAFPDTIKNPFIKNPANIPMSMSTGAVVVYPFNSPKLINRVVVQGLFTDPVLVELLGIDLTTVVYTATIPAGITGLDSGNITSVMGSAFRVTSTGSAIITSIGLYKSKGGSSAGGSPASPSNVQALQQVVLDEVDLTGSTIPGVVTGTVPDLFTKGIGTTPAVINGAYNNGIHIHFKFPILISRIAFTGLQVRLDADISVKDVDGNYFKAYDGSSFAASSYGTGLDTGNFKDLALTPWPFGAVTPPVGSPVLATDIYYTFDINASAETASISEITILKTIETKAFAYNEPSEPLYTEDDQLISYDEIVWKNSSILPVLGLLSGQIQYPFLKNPQLGGVQVGPLAAYTVMFNAPKLVSRVVLSGVFASDIEIQYYDVNMILQTLVADYPPHTVSGYGYDSGNIEPTIMLGMVVTVLSASYSIEIDNWAIWKTREAKSASSRVATPETVLFSALDIDPATQVGPDGSTIPPLTALAGQGRLIEKDVRDAIDAIIAITGYGSETFIDAYVNWYYSDDNISYYYFATTHISETPATGNPSGYESAGDTSNRWISHPVGAYAKYICCSVSNNDPTALHIITVTLSIVSQR